MLGKIKNYATKKLLEKQLKDVPPDQREMLMGMMEKDPQLFENIANDIKSEMKQGSSQTQAAMKVMPKYQEKLQKLMGGNMPGGHGGGAQFNPDGSIHK